MIVIRYLFVLLLGALLGAFGVGFALQKGYGDVLLKNAPTVADLERRLGEMEQERNRLGRQLESVESRAAKMERLFSDLETRFQALSAGGAGTPAPPAAAVAGGTSAPPAAAPPGVGAAAVGPAQGSATPPSGGAAGSDVVGDAKEGEGAAP